MNRVIRIDEIAKLNKETYKKNQLPNIVKYLDTGNLTKNKIDSFQYLNPEVDKIPSRAQRKVDKDSILYSTVRPNQEHYGIIENEIDGLIVSTGFTTIDVEDEGVCPKYLYYILTQNYLTEYLHTLAQNSVSSYPSISPHDLGSLKFNIPELKIQLQITKVLSDLDAKIEVNNKINAELEAMAKTIYDYWFVQFDFPDKNGKPYKSSGGKMVYNKELKREIPEGWDAKELNEIFVKSTKSLNPAENPNKSFKYYSIPGFDKTGTFIHELGKEIKSNKFVVKPLHILVSKLNPWFNRVIYPEGKNDEICSTEFVIWELENENEKNFYYQLAKTKHFIDSCSLWATGTSNSHKRVNPDFMLSYKIPYNRDIIEGYGQLIGPSIKRSVAVLKENQKLADLRDWLLPMLMNGQVTVGEAEEHLGRVAEDKESYKLK